MMDPSVSTSQSTQIAIVWWGGLVLVSIGLLKFAFYLAGAHRPGWFEKIQSPTLKRFLAGRSNRLVFGWGGFVTIVVGGFFMAAAWLMAYFAEKIEW
jgi:hypothetical protein